MFCIGQELAQKFRRVTAVALQRKQAFCKKCEPEARAWDPISPSNLQWGVTARQPIFKQHIPTASFLGQYLAAQNGDASRYGQGEEDN